MHRDIMELPKKEAIERLNKLGFLEPEVAYANITALSFGASKNLISALIEAALRSPNPDGCLTNVERVVEGADIDHLIKSLDGPSTIERLAFLCGASPFLSSILAQNPLYYEWLFINNGLSTSNDRDGFVGALSKLSEGVDTIERMMSVLRRHRNGEFLRIGSRDLLGLADLKETTREISDLASASLEAAYRFAFVALKKIHGAPLCTDDNAEASFTIIGLGKLGGRELNFSSDIDIMYIYSSEKGETTGIGGKPGSVISNHAFFVKLSTMINKLIGSVTEDGFVFRVDLDLRPEGRSGDMANGLSGIEQYYESWGQTWERAMLLKARPVAGDEQLGKEFLSIIKPFVYRRYLDFTTLDEIKGMKEKIDLSLLRRNPDTVDCKLGAGGIREIEFFCQALQLIHAGKDVEIRERNTLNAIELLRLKGHVKHEDADALTDAYVFLRNLEHRIQIVEGRQTQAVPARAEELAGLARMMGHKGGTRKSASEHLGREFRKKTAKVHDIYRSLFYKEDTAKDVPEEVSAALAPEISREESAGRLKALGFKEPGEARSRLRQIESIATRARLSARGRVLLQKLMPIFLNAAVNSPDADLALLHLDLFTASVGIRSTFYALLFENPLITRELLKLFGTSVFLSRLLIGRPENIDLLLSKELSIPIKRRESFFSELDYSEDYEAILDSIRRIKSQELFRIGVNDIRGTLSSGQVSRQMTLLAETAIEAAIKIASADLTRLYGDPSEGSFAVLGLGKLGGREIIYGSDLDIVFAYIGAGDTDAKTTGARQITNHEFYVKLGARVISVLTLKTREGDVFSVDVRLRPSGSSGPLVVSRQSMLEYHAGSVSIWERQAYLKARVVAGDIAAGNKLLKELNELLLAKPLVAADVDEMQRIRKRMEDELAKETDLRYNIKTGRGGIVDIEFMVQALQLKNAANSAVLTPSTTKAILRISKAGIIDSADAAFLIEAYHFLRLIELRLRVVHDRPEGNLIAGAEELNALAKRLGYQMQNPGDELLAVYKEKAQRVRALYFDVLKKIKD